MSRKQCYLDGKEDVGGADDVVVLREDGPGAVDHGVGRRALLPEVHHRIGLEALERLREEVKVADVPNLQLDVLPADLPPPAAMYSCRHLRLVHIVHKGLLRADRNVGSRLVPFPESDTFYTQ